MSTNKITIGTRSSALAMWQTEFVISKIKASNPGIEIKIKTIKTTGDKILDVALAKVGDKGLFVKEIEEVLLKGEIDLAVHSMKDVPTNLPDGLCISAILQREDNRDIFISDSYKKIYELPPNAVIGTSSLRRIAQLMSFRSDLKFKDLRGNIQTRLKKMKEMNLDGIILAAAGVKRLGFKDNIQQYIPYDLILPAVGQGSIGIEIKSDDDEIRNLMAPLNHEESYWSIIAERAMMRRLKGGCQVPIGSFGRVEKGRLILDGVIASLDGKRLYKGRQQGEINLHTKDFGVGVKDAEEIGIKLAEDLLAQGGDKILEEIYSKL